METILKVENLSIEFGGLKAVDNLNMAINQGEIYGLIGPNGAGKTTVFNCITQFYKADFGDVILIDDDNEYDLNEVAVHEIINYGIARTFQNVELVKELSVIENVLIGAHKSFKTNFIEHAFQTSKVKEEENRMRKKAESLLSKFDILHLKDSIAGSLSYGNQKKVEFVRALMSDPKLIILDEPAAGLNDIETEEFADLILLIASEMNITILLVEHDMRLVMSICDRITVISFGKEIATGTATEIQQDPSVQEAYLGSVD